MTRFSNRQIIIFSSKNSNEYLVGTIRELVNALLLLWSVHIVKILQTLSLLFTGSRGSMTSSFDQMLPSPAGSVLLEGRTHQRSTQKHNYPLLGLQLVHDPLQVRPQLIRYEKCRLSCNSPSAPFSNLTLCYN